MKIVMIISTLAGRGGAERVVSVLSTWLARSHEVTVAAFETTPPAYAFGGDIVSLGFPAQTAIWRKGINSAGRVVAIARLLQRVQPDRILAFMESANFPTILAAMLLDRLNRVSVCVQDNPAGFPDAHQRLMRVLYPRAGRVVAVSEGVRAALIRQFGIAANRCVTIPNTIDVDAIDRTLAEADPPPLPADQYLVAAGRLVPQKGFDILIQAYRQLPNTAPPLLIFGEGPDRPALEKQIQTLGLAGRVALPGAVPNLYPYLANATCFVLSSRHEGWPLVLMEAMACGCPIVSSDCDYGPSEILEPGKSGLLVPPEDVSALSTALDRILHDPILRGRLSREARARVNALRVERIASAWLTPPLERVSSTT